MSTVIFNLFLAISTLLQILLKTSFYFHYDSPIVFLLDGAKSLSLILEHTVFAKLQKMSVFSALFNFFCTKLECKKTCSTQIRIKRKLIFFIDFLCFITSPFMAHSYNKLAINVDEYNNDLTEFQVCSFFSPLERIYF